MKVNLLKKKSLSLSALTTSNNQVTKYNEKRYKIQEKVNIQYWNYHVLSNKLK